MFTPFYNQTTRYTVIAFGDLFNKLFVVRRNPNGTENKRISIPIEYAPKQKWYRKIKELEKRDPTTRSDVILPRLSFEITNVIPDLSRRMQLPQKLYNTVAGVTKNVFAPTPYKYQFELNLMTENSDDGFQIIEQILPYFNPTFNLSVNSLPDIGYTEDFPLTLNNIVKNDEYSGDFEAARIQTWTLSFDMKVNIYGPITDATLIKKALTHIHVVDDNGDGTGNISADQEDGAPIRTIIKTEPNPIDATKDSDYGYSIVITEPIGNTKFNPVTGLYEDI